MGQWAKEWDVYRKMGYLYLQQHMWSIGSDKRKFPDCMAAEIGNKAWVRWFMCHYCLRTVETTFVRSAIYPCSSPWSCKRLHVVLLWPWCHSYYFVLTWRCCWCCSFVPWCTTLCNVFVYVETMMVWFAVTATAAGLWISHKVVTSPDSKVRWGRDW